MDALPASHVDQRRCDLAEQSFHEARELGSASRARLHARRLLVEGLVGDVRICAPLWAVSVFDSDRRKPRSASTSARIERRIWSGKCGSLPVSKRDAAGSVIHAGKLANEPSGCSTTTNSTPPHSSRRPICTTSPKRGWNRWVIRASVGCSWAVCRHSEQDLDHPNINVLFKQMGRKAVPQGVRRHALLEVGHLGGGMAGARELTCRYRVGWVLARKQPSLRPRDTIPVAQKFKQRRGKHRVAILATPRLRWGRLLPCSMRSIMRLESISQTFSAATSETRSPAP